MDMHSQSKTYPSQIRNAVILLSATVALVSGWLFIRGQVTVSDSQFLRSMIPHHAGGLPSRVAQDSAAVASTVDHFRSALADGDSATAMSLLADDVIVLESGDIETRDQYRAEHLPADIQFARSVTSTPQPVLLVVRSNVAWAVSSSRARGTFHGRSIDSQGAELMVLARERDGWKIRAIHWSSHSVTPSR